MGVCSGLWEEEGGAAWRLVSAAEQIGYEWDRAGLSQAGPLRLRSGGRIWLGCDQKPPEDLHSIGVRGDIQQCEAGERWNLVNSLGKLGLRSSQLHPSVPGTLWPQGIW